MGCPTEVEIGDNLVFTANTHSPTTAAAMDADAVPTYRIYEDETGTAILNGSMAKLDDANTIGFYSESIAATSVNGFENGKNYSVYITATVSAQAGTTSYNLKAYDAKKANVVQLGSATQSATDLKDFADAGYDPATNKVQGVVLVDTTTTNTDMVDISDLPTNTEFEARTISPTAASALEDQFDGTGLSGDTYPSTQAQLANIANVGSAVHTPATSYTLTTGTQTANLYTDTVSLNGIRHTHVDVAGELVLEYVFNIGAGTPSSVIITGALTGSNDDLEVLAYDYSAASYVQIGILEGKVSSINEVNSYDLFTGMVGYGANLGEVKIKLQDGGYTLSSATLYIDQIYTSFSSATSTYDNGAIWIDDSVSNTNTVVGVDGVATNPVSTWVAALTLSASTNLNKFEIANGTSITLTGDTSNYSLIGDNWILALASQIISGAYIKGASVSGIGLNGGENPTFEHCEINNVSIPGTDLRYCALAGTLIITEVATYYFTGCYSGVAGTSAPILDFGALVGSSNINLRHYSGGIDIRNMGQSGVDNMSLEGQGQYILNANCIGGTLAVRGAFQKTDNSGLVTIVDDANIYSGVIHAGRAQSATSNTITLSSKASSTNGAYDPSQIALTAGTGEDQCRLILQYDGTSKIAVVDRDWKTTPDSTTDYKIITHPGREHVNEGLAQDGTSTTIKLNTLASSSDDAYVNQVCFIRSGAGEDQARLITDYNGTTKFATVHRAWDVIPGVTSGYVILPAMACDPDTVAKIGSEMNLAADAITSAKYDESSAFPIKFADSGLTLIARTGADADTLETLSDQVDGTSTITTAETLSTATAALNAYDPPTKAEQDAAFTEIKGATWSSVTDTLENIRDKQTDIETDTADIQTTLADATYGLSALKTLIDALPLLTEITGVEVDNDGTAISLEGAFKLILSVLTGESGGGGTSILTFRDIADTKNRLSVTVDANGNRTVVGTRDAS